jgi:N-acetylglucosaminyldiphosphoundecaprenol N-acetyl-beta-D-mannosaminyltransferase
VDSIDILGCRLDLLDQDEATEAILCFAREDAAAQIVTLGTEMVVYAQHDPAFRAVLNSSALSLCDTVGVLTVARRRGAHLRERVTGVELTEKLCQHAAEEGLSVYLFGGAEGVAADAAAILEVSFPGLIVAGTRNGFCTDDEEAAIVDTIRASGARIVFIGLGSPRQEMWLARHLRASGCGAGVGVGGSFDVISGRVKRAPMIWRQLGIEWLYRLIREPQRLRRQLALPYFVWLVTLDTLGVRRQKGVDDS